MKTTAIIVDDELRARILLRKILEDFPEVEVLDECSDLSTAIKSIRKLSPQLVFLDIEMPGRSGLEILEFFDEDEIDFDIIFITAYNQFVFKAFKLSAIDYLLKPVDAEELKLAIDRHLKKNEKKYNQWNVLKANLENVSQERIAVPNGNSIKFISPEEILFIKADSSYSEIHFVNGSLLIVSRTLKNFEDALNDTNGFMRLHKSYLVNIKQVTDFVKSDGGSVILTSGIQLPVSNEKSPELLMKMKMIKR
jgi:two-component system LytT family response regulator